MQLNKIKGLQMKTFSEKFEQNANLQLRKVTRAIDLYVKNVYIKSKLIRYVSSQAGFGMMQPLALKNFSDVVYSYLEPIIGSDNISMFTVVVDKYNFGQDNWNFQYKSFQKKIKKIFKGYDYIANVALDEFPRISFQQDGTLMTPHIHGIFFRTLTRWEKSKLAKAIKKYFPESRIRPFVVRPQYDLESAIQYSFKALFGGKRTFTRRDLTVGLKNTSMTYKAIYTNFTHLKRFKIYDLAFAGGKGKEILRNIIRDIENGS
jgi:hypothetical protein